MQLVHTTKGEAYSLLQAVHLQPLQRNPLRALSLGSVENWITLKKQHLTYM